MSGTLYLVFVLAALVCVIAGVVAVTRTRRASREDEEQYPEMSYAEEQAAVEKAQAAQAEAAAGAGARDEDDEEPVA